MRLKTGFANRKLGAGIGIVARDGRQARQFDAVFHGFCLRPTV